MSELATAQFPTKVWDGASATRTADIGTHAAPTAEDFNQLFAELAATQELLRTFALANIALTGLKVYVGDGVNSSGGAAVDATFTGAAVGERVIAMFGLVKADAGTQAHSFIALTIGTDVTATIGTVNKIEFKAGVADKSSYTFVALCAPALTEIAVQ